VHSLRGAKRIARHLWRMCMALLIAAFSFFIGQAKVIPRPIRIVPLLMVPPLLVLFTMLYWMWRVRARRSLRGLEIRPQERVRPEPRLDLLTAQTTRQD
jgi:predicted histidine transporter YuiF (NhaC family)